MGVAWIKRGREAKEQWSKQNKKDDDKRKNLSFRFFLPRGKSAMITFLDGKINDEGILDCPMYYEHQLHMNGSWKNWFVCVGTEGACPICEGTGKEPAYVMALSVIDHSKFTSKKDQKEYKNQRRLFVFKRDTLKMLISLAKMQGGSLVGLTFRVSRSDEERSPNVGDDFDFQGKSSVEGLKKKYGDQADPFDYEKALPYVPAEELRKMGFGSGNRVGDEAPVEEASPDKDKGGSSGDDDMPPFDLDPDES